MDDKTWERYGLLGGVGFAVLILISSIIPGAPPQLDDSGAKIAEYFSDHDRALRLATFLAGLALIGIVWWIGSLWRVMRRAEGGEPRLAVVAFGGLLFSGAMAFSGMALQSAIAMRIDSLGDDGAKFFYTVAAVLFALTNFGIALLVGSVSALALRTKFLPDWLAWAGAGVAALAVISGAGCASERGVFTVLGLITLLLWLVWIVAVSLVLYRPSESATPAPPLPPTV